MKLNKFRVQHYRSIIDTDFIESEDIMVLVGPNQAGKSSILKGLNSIAFDYSYDVQNELTQLENINKKYVDNDLKPSDLPIITAVFSLNDDDVSKLKESIDQADFTGQENELKEIKITKFIDESYVVDIAGKPISFPDVFGIVTDVETILDEMQTKYGEEFKPDPNKPFKDTYEQTISECLDLIPYDGYAFENKKKITSIIKKFCENKISESLQDDIEEDINKIDSILEDYPDNKLLKIFTFLVENLPRPVYFKDYERLEDSLTLTEIHANPKRHQAFLNLLQLAEVKLHSVDAQIGDEMAIQQYLENASGIASKKIREVWRQETFDLKIRYSNKQLMIFTTNPSEPGTLLPPSYGSEGFQWFLGFFINFAVATKTQYKNAILLLDDPGVLLHPTGHKDLLNRFKEYLQDEVRTIYSTHLPSLIPKDSVNSIRVVYKESGKTHIVKNFWKLGNKDIWEPVRASLGIDLTDSLFLGNQTVMVEGPSDQIYLQEFLKFAQKTNKNLSHRFLLPIRGLHNTGYFLALFDSQGLSYVALLDSTGKFQGNKKVVKMNPKNKFRNEQQDFDIEDMIENELLSNAFSNLFTTIDSSKVLQKLNNEKTKAVTILKDILQENGKKKTDLDKVELANQIIKIVKNAPDNYQKTIENFTSLLGLIERKF